jgi:hypothetical protein
LEKSGGNEVKNSVRPFIKNPVAEVVLSRRSGGNEVKNNVRPFIIILTHVTAWFCAWNIYGKKTSFLPDSNKQNNPGRAIEAYSLPTSLH